jgi:LacI family transcriptional regulator
MSVSRVVNGTRKVGPEVERKVRTAIERIGYEPNEAARILKGHRARVVGVIVPDLADPFFATCVNAIQEALREADYMSWMAASGHKEDIERQDVQIMVKRKVAGLLVIPSGFQNDHFLAARRSGIPIVSFDRPLENFDADRLVVDNRAASSRATQHLIDHGHQHILCVRGSDDDKSFTRIERITGYSQTMRRAKHSARFCYMPGSLSASPSNQLEFALKSHPAPTAIFATDNTVAVRVLRELQKHSVKIPDKMALIAFDDFDAADLMRPTITVVRQPTVDIGRQAASMLLARIRGDVSSNPKEVVLPTELVIRESCGCGKHRSKIIS